MTLFRSLLARRTAFRRAAADSYTPARVFAAMKIPVLPGLHSPLLGIPSLGGGASRSEIQTAFRFWGLPAPEVNYIEIDRGARRPYGEDPGADEENHLDVEQAGALWAYAAGTPLRILMAWARNDNPRALEELFQALREHGVADFSLSWGAPRVAFPPVHRAALYRTLQGLADVATVSVAAGDGSLYDGTRGRTTDVPAGGMVWAVGGTSMTLNADGTIAREAAWGDGNPADAGGGGGWDLDNLAPPWQQPVLAGRSPYRGVPDASWPADPETAPAYFAGGRWVHLGGTSAGAPAYAAYFALAKAHLAKQFAARGGAGKPPSFGHPGATLYANAARCFRDVVIGSNGEPALPGYDLATGLGALDGTGALAVFEETLLPAQVPPARPVEVIQAPPAPAPAAAEASALRPADQIAGLFAAYATTLGVGAAEAPFARLKSDVLAVLDGQLPQGPAPRLAPGVVAALGVAKRLLRLFGPLAEGMIDGYLARSGLPEQERQMVLDAVKGLENAVLSDGAAENAAEKPQGDPNRSPAALKAFNRLLHSVARRRALDSFTPRFDDGADEEDASRRRLVFEIVLA